MVQHNQGTKNTFVKSSQVVGWIFS